MGVGYHYSPYSYSSDIYSAVMPVNHQGEPTRSQHVWPFKTTVDEYVIPLDAQKGLYRNGDEIVTIDPGLSSVSV